MPRLETADALHQFCTRPSLAVPRTLANEAKGRRNTTGYRQNLLLGGKPIYMPVGERLSLTERPTGRVAQVSARIRTHGNVFEVFAAGKWRRVMLRGE